MSYLRARILSEIAILAVRFGEVNFDEQGLEWVHIPVFELPTGWNQASTELLIDLPFTYPEVPPDGFYIEKNLAPLNGNSLEHYFQHHEVNRHDHLDWAWYCIHPAKFSWQPSADITQGDNLVKYLELIRLALTEAAR